MELRLHANAENVHPHKAPIALPNNLAGHNTFAGKTSGWAT